MAEEGTSMGKVLNAFCEARGARDILTMAGFAISCPEDLGTRVSGNPVGRRMEKHSPIFPSNM